MSEELGFAAGARTKEQLKKMKEMEKTIKCGFCNYKNPILENEVWMVKKNDFPYPHHKHHLIIFSRYHLEMENVFSLLTAEDWRKLGRLILRTVDKFQISGGAFVMRFGSHEYNACTMRHVHGHIQVPDESYVQKHKKEFKTDNDFYCLQPHAESKYWQACRTKNKFPNQSETYCISLISGIVGSHLPKHLDKWADLGEIVKDLCFSYEIPGGGIVLRFGDSAYNNAKIKEVHAIVHVPDNSGEVIDYFLTDQNDQPVVEKIKGKNEKLFKATFHKSLKKLEQDRERIAEFEKELSK